jgi:hypothetical protein
VSSAALFLHAEGLLASFADGRPGFVPDRYLATLGRPAGPAVAELCALGVWVRAEGGFRILASEAARMAIEVERQLQATRRQSS